jgi:hypothetical protein
MLAGWTGIQAVERLVEGKAERMAAEKDGWMADKWAVWTAEQ